MRRSPPRFTKAERAPARRRSSATRSAVRPLPMPPRSRWVPGGSVTRRRSGSSSIPTQPRVGRGSGPATAGPGADLVEGPVVPGLDQGVVHGGVEAVGGALPAVDGGAQQVEGLGIDEEAASLGPVEPTEEAVGLEPAPSGLELVDAPASADGQSRIVRQDGEMDVGAHRPEPELDPAEPGQSPGRRVRRASAGGGPPQLPPELVGGGGAGTVRAPGPGPGALPEGEPLELEPETEPDDPLPPATGTYRRWITMISGRGCRATGRGWVRSGGAAAEAALLAAASVAT